MATLKDLYSYYCRRWNCKPNSSFCAVLDDEYVKHNNQRILYEVDLSSNYLGKNGLRPVLDLVKNCKTVSVLDVSNNRLEHEQLEYLVYSLVLHPSIQRVLLCNNCLHEKSIDHILKLLDTNHRIVELDLSGNNFLPVSLSLVSKCLNRNRMLQAQIKSEDEEIAKHRATLAAKPLFQAEVYGELTENTSGGHLHYSTWRKNPQYRICVSRTSRVSIVLESRGGMLTRQVGFVIMRCDSIRRVIHLKPDTIVAESPVEAAYCATEVMLEESGNYVVMPFVFRPGQTNSYTLRATMINDIPTLEEGWVTLDLIDEQHDWRNRTIDALWPAKGGCSLLNTWRYNNMYHIRYDKSVNACFHSSEVEVYVLLTKNIDPDFNDEKEIGLDVVSESLDVPGRPPLFCTPEVRHWGATHALQTSVSLSFTLPLGELNVYVIPSTKVTGQEGCYTLDIFCSAPFVCATSEFPHGWNYRQLESNWNDLCCGGLRSLYQSWKNNPSVKVELTSRQELTQDGDTGAVLIACLEPLEAHHVKSEAVLTERVAELFSKQQNNNVCLSDGEKELKHAAEAFSFYQRHNRRMLEVCLTVVDTVAPHFNNLVCTEVSHTEAHLKFIGNKDIPFYLVAMTREAGQMGNFRMHLFSQYPFVLDDVMSLAERERADKLSEYEREKQQRRAQQEKAIHNEGQSSMLEDADSRQKRDDILANCLLTGDLFMDRDFPIGNSSLCLDPEVTKCHGFPQKISWVRASSISEDAECLREGYLSPPFPYNARHWFASVLYAISAKPHWLAHIFLEYNKKAGFARFLFFKLNEWVHVLVDDYLPVDAAGALCLGHSVNVADMFYPLAEKAYAKLHRCYQVLEPQVSPGLSFKDLIVQGLRDVSSGYCEVHSLGHGIESEPLSRNQKDNLWRMFKDSMNSKVLLALMLDSQTSKASEKKSVGILLDHLYTVTDARFIEKQRLVKVRNWCDDENTRWKGKWGPHSPLWTETLLHALEYNHDLVEFWISFDEVLFYFSDLFHVEQHASVCSISGVLWGSGKEKNGRAVGTDMQLRFPQFAMQISNVPSGCHTLDIVAGVHQADARLSITRDQNAKAEYKNAFGLAALNTEDNGRFVKNFEASETISMSVPSRSRDVFIKFNLDATAIVKQTQFITLMVLQDIENTVDIPYYITARSSQACVSITPVSRDSTINVKGKWAGATAGGLPQASTWRNNPQFFLYPSETMELTISLILVSSTINDGDNPYGSRPPSIGFTVHNTRDCRSFLHFEPETVVFSVPADEKLCVLGTVTLSGMKERRGMPYVIVPYCSNQELVGHFTLEVLSNRKVSLMPIDSRLDWSRCVNMVHVDALYGNAGGSPKFPSWRWSPQLILDFPISQEGRLFISAANCKVDDVRNEIGMILLYSDLSIDDGHRRRLYFDSNDIVGKSEEAIGRVNLEVELNLHTRPGPLVLLVYTVIPYREVDIEVSFYSQPALEVSVATDWKSTALLEGCWELGKTAGGSRTKFASWINNPFVGLSVIRPTNIVAVLVQYLRYREPPIVKRNGTKKAFLPPITVIEDRKTFLELDLVRYDERLTPISSVGPSNKAEVVLAQKLEPCDDKPYIFVPATSLMEDNNDFKLVVFSDHPIDLFLIEKSRLPYI
ncbi:unnamed protein product [Phytomonas sp. Hart1]|nr:unnamed protein product [Phytomonas sp. Hart1]|eukprot:CCW71840.1 unnamed protein product [Phytomonas sp. isolate Hart1]